MENKIRKKIFVAGHNGMVGSAIFKKLSNDKSNDIIVKSKTELDLINQKDVKTFFNNQKIDEIYIAAAKVGGIYANSTFPGEFIYNNLMIQSNIIHNAFLTGVKKILFLGSSCIYPKKTSQPMKETSLLDGKLEKTNEAYAIAKIAGIKMCESYNLQYEKDFGLDYRCLMPTNLYGPGDNYHSLNSHVIPALIKRFHNAKQHNIETVKIWGSGMAKREFLFVDDLATAAIFYMNLTKDKIPNNVKKNSHINVGFGKDISIRDLSNVIASTIGYQGKIEFDKSKPDGHKQKLLDSELLKSLGWQPSIELKEGLLITYKDFLKNYQKHIRE